MRDYKKIIVIIICSMIFLMGFSMKQTKQNDIKILTDAFNSTGADLESYTLSFSSAIGLYQDEEKLLETGNRISNVLNIPIKEELIDFNNKKVYMSKGVWENQTDIEVKIFEYKNELFIAFKLIGTSSLDEMEENYIKLNKKLQELQIFIKINSCIQGNVSDKLNNAEQLVLIYDALKKIEAEEVESLNIESVKSISAYTPNIHTSIMTGNKKMNFQVATHNDTVTQKTILTMGTPIIVVEY